MSHLDVKPDRLLTIEAKWLIGIIVVCLGVLWWLP